MKINGSAMILCADTKEEAMSIVEKDVYCKSGVWDLSKVRVAFDISFQATMVKMEEFKKTMATCIAYIARKTGLTFVTDTNHAIQECDTDRVVDLSQRENVHISFH